jgi:serine/threonine protein kinase
MFIYLFKFYFSDFGLSKVMDQHTKTMTSCGTAAWAAPEILKNSRYTEKADVYR